MGEPGLWKYCTAGHCREMILSLRLLEGEEWTQGRVLSCLYAISNHTEKHYNKQKLIKKGGGVRHILAPDPVLKTVQRNILHHVLEGLEVSPCAMAYHKGASVRLNAACHMDKQVVLKLDIKDFLEALPSPWYIGAPLTAGIFRFLWGRSLPPCAAARTVFRRGPRRPQPYPTW